VVMKCSRIYVNSCGNVIVTQDDCRFWLMVNHGRRVHAYVEPYTFPSIIFQVNF
jgi:hypothetical protein